MSDAPLGAPSERAPHRPTALEVWLRHDELPYKERVDRLAGDAELEASLREQGFEGDDWEFVVNVFAEYGVGVISGWIRRGVIVAKCAEKKYRVPTLPPGRASRSPQQRRWRK